MSHTVSDGVSDTVQVEIDGRRVAVAAGASVAAALIDAGVTAFRSSVRGEPRAPLCGMGICHECRVTIDGVPHRRSCMVQVADGMRVATTGAVPTATTPAPPPTSRAGEA
ncbi:MAG TPA: (2Fe-2S)-binding protein [Gemmatimonadales bacterium]